MNAIETLDRLANTKVINHNLKYCLVDKNKKPFKIDNTFAKPNKIEDFVNFEELLLNDSLENYSSIGVSIQGSKICAIDVDKCFSKPNDINSIDERGKNILEMFKDKTYCEFSFSGTGLRILFYSNIIENYSSSYYIKNEKTKVEFYQPTKSFRYVTLTGNTLNDLDINNIDEETLILFLNLYMKKDRKEKRKIKKENNNGLTLEQLLLKTKIFYFKNIHFQQLWFGKAPGSNSNESELDYEIIANIYENITQEKDKIKIIFESSPYFKSKDYKHKKKWKAQEGRYYNYIFEQIERSH